MGDGKPKTKATHGYQMQFQLVRCSLIKVLVWQHPDFNIKTGFTGSGLEGMMKEL